MSVHDLAPDDEKRAEQEYFDTAHDLREEKRETRRSAAASAGDHKAAARLAADAASDTTLGRPTDEVAFLRVDSIDGDCFYIGRHAIVGPDGELVVYPWQAPAIMAMREATVQDPKNLRRRREFRTTGNDIESFEDLIFAEIAARLEDLDDPELALMQADHMLDEALTRDRSPQMQQIAQTIQALQSKLIRTSLETLLVIQGGPGTGKTAVALHRVSWLLHEHRGSLAASDVLVVGPHPTFTRYINMVLPELGDEHVTQTDVVGMLQAPVMARTKDAPEVATLKGDARLADVIAQGLRDRLRAPREESVFTIDRLSWRVGIEPQAVDEILHDLRTDYYVAGRTKFRDRVTEAVVQRIRKRHTEERRRLGSDPRILISAVEVDAFVERVWPQLSPQAFLRDLLGSLERLVSAASGVLTAEEVQLLRRQSAARLSEERWSKEDLVLMDAAAAEMNGTDETYQHIVVDEAQDLSPMQLRAIRRRSRRGSMTIVGDIAQSTGLWSRDSWDDVTQALRTSLPVVAEDLTHGYRVPRAVMELAARLLPAAAPGVEPPTVVRDVEPGPTFHAVPEGEDLAAAVVAAVQAHSSKGRFVGVVCPDSRREEVQGLLDDQRVQWRNADEGTLGASINVVSPVAAKGLEFDAVVVVDPSTIVKAGPEGFRMLYIALTRTTRFLDVVHPADALPELLRDPGAQAGAVEDATEPLPSDLAERSTDPVGAGEVALHAETGTPVPVPVPAASESRVGRWAATTQPTSPRDRTIRFQADALLEQLAETAPRGLWADIVDEVQRRLQEVDQQL